MDLVSDEESKLIAIDEEANHQIMHRGCFGKADRATHEPLDAGRRLMCLLNSLRVLLAHLMLRWVDMPFIRSPSVGIKARNTKWLQ